VLKLVKLMLLWKRPEERGAMNLEGFKRERGTSTGLTDKDRDEFKRLSDTAVSQEGRLGTMKRGGSVKSSAGRRT
jgi:hypothetical protein